MRSATSRPPAMPHPVLVLHAIWPESLGELHLWAEGSSRPTRSPDDTASVRAPLHSFAADPVELSGALRGARNGVVSLADLELEDVVLLLPPTGTSPRASARLLRDEAVDVETVEALSGSCASRSLSMNFSASSSRIGTSEAVVIVVTIGTPSKVPGEHR